MPRKIFWFLCFAVVLACFHKGVAEDVTLTMDKRCYKDGDSMILTAAYGGSDTLVGVEWYYSERNSQNVIVKPDCSVFQTDTGFPSNITYKCPPDTEGSNIFQLILDSVSQSDLDNITWGATFQVSGTSPELKTVQPESCETTTPTPTPSTTTKVPEGSSTTEETTTTTTTSTSPPTSPPTFPPPSPTPSPDDNTNKIIGIGVGVGVAVLLGVSVGVCLYCRHKKMKHKQEQTKQSETVSEGQMHNLASDIAVYSENRL